MAEIAFLTEAEAFDWCVDNNIDYTDNIQHRGVVYVVLDSEKTYPESEPEPTPEPVKQDKKGEPVGVPIEDKKADAK